MSKYLDELGSIPTKQQVAAYLNSSSSDPIPEVRTSDQAILARAGFYTYFRSGSWIKRNGIWSLSVMPRSGGIGNYGVSRTWSPVYAKFNGSSQWVKYKSRGANASMYKQYKCHFKYGMLKTPWNLEPHKRTSEVSWLTCN